MSRIFRKLVALPFLLLAPYAAAQEGSPGFMSVAVAERVRALPDQLADLPRVDGGYSAPLVAYRGRDSLDPVIAIVFSDVAKASSWRDIADLGRGNAIQAGLINTLFEGRFGLTGHPGATTYFGDYLTKNGIKQSWIAEYDGVRITVSATIYRPEDRRAVFEAIRRNLLGGAEMTTVAPADAN